MTDRPIGLAFGVSTNNLSGFANCICNKLCRGRSVKIDIDTFEELLFNFDLFGTPRGVDWKGGGLVVRMCRKAVQEVPLIM